MGEDDKDLKLSPQQVANLLREAVAGAIKEGKGSSSDFAKAKEPFTRKTEIEKNAERFGILVSRPKSTADAKKKLKFFRTGTWLDNLFLDEDNKPAGGIPMVVQMGIVGLPDVGKSIFAQEIILRCASEGKRVVFVTSEDAWESASDRFDLQSRMKQKADIMGLDWEDIRNNLFIFDAISHSEFRDWRTFVDAYRYLVETLGGIDLLVVDSITLMESYRGALKYRLMELARYNQINGITAIYVCQRSEEKADSYSMAGGIGLGHNLDATLCIDIGKAMGRMKDELKKKQWAEVHFARILGCRLCGFSRLYNEVSITENGFLEIYERDDEEESKKKKGK